MYVHQSTPCGNEAKNLLVRESVEHSQSDANHQQREDVVLKVYDSILKMFTRTHTHHFARNYLHVCKKYN